MNAKRKCSERICVAVLTTWLIGSMTREASAYIDPGTGGSLFSSLAVLLGVVSACLAVGFTQLRHLGGWVRDRLSAGKDKQEQPVEGDNR